MAYIYCLYSTDDGEPRYIGKASDKVSYCFKQHITAALEKTPGSLYDWMRDVWRRNQDVMCYTLQEGIALEDEELFEQYWIGQFGDLLNADDRASKDTAIGKQIKTALRESLDLSRTVRP